MAFDVMTAPELLDCGALVTAFQTLAATYEITEGSYTCAEQQQQTATALADPGVLLAGPGGGAGGGYVTISAVWPSRSYTRAFKRMLAAVGSSVELLVVWGRVPCGTEVRALLRGPTGAVRHWAAYGCPSAMPADHVLDLTLLGMEAFPSEALCCRPPPPPRPPATPSPSPAPPPPPGFPSNANASWPSPAPPPLPGPPGDDDSADGPPDSTPSDQLPPAEPLGAGVSPQPPPAPDQPPLPSPDSGGVGGTKGSPSDPPEPPATGQ